jgi:hypothetical protein
MEPANRLHRKRFWQFPLWVLFVVTVLAAMLAAERAKSQNGGPYLKTGKPLDLAIAGPGFFEVQDEFGRLLYTRDGRIDINSEGQLIIGGVKNRLVVQPTITIPSDGFDITIQRDGKVLVMQPGETSPSEIGQLQLATFISITGMREAFPGSRLFTQTDESGPTQLQYPEPDMPGVLLQGMLNNEDRDPRWPWFLSLDLGRSLTILCGALLLAELARLRSSVNQLNRQVKELILEKQHPSSLD